MNTSLIAQFDITFFKRTMTAHLIGLSNKRDNWQSQAKHILAVLQRAYWQIEDVDSVAAEGCWY